MQDRPIGVFDSGVGGLTVVKTVLKRFAGEGVLYIADQAHVPYGGRPLDEVRAFATEVSRFLADQGCSAVIMACNISSATALDEVRKMLAPLPVLGVIAPAAQRVAADYDGPIGVLATEGTVKSGAYTTHIKACNPSAQVHEVACPKFVPLVEAGELTSRDADSAVREYLQPLLQAGCRTIVLGCTHYPFLLDTLRCAAQGLCNEPVRFVDPADEVVDTLQRAVPGLASYSIDGADHMLLTTGSLARFREQTPLFLPGVRCVVGTARWTEELTLTRR